MSLGNDLGNILRIILQSETHWTISVDIGCLEEQEVKGLEGETDYIEVPIVGLPGAESDEAGLDLAGSVNGENEKQERNEKLEHFRRNLILSEGFRRLKGFKGSRSNKI